MKHLPTALLLIILSACPIAMSQIAPNIQRAVDGAIKLQTHFKNPADLVLDSVTLAPGKRGSDVCYSFHSRSQFDVIAPKGNMGIEVRTADFTMKDKLRIWPATQGIHFRPCVYNQANATDITKQVLAQLP